MRNWFKNLFNFLFSTITLAITILYLIGCLLPWVDATVFWPFALVSLLFPYLLIGLICLIAIWVFLERRKSFILFLICCLGYKQMSVLIAYNPKKTFVEEKQPEHIRVVSWNIGNMEGKTHRSNAKVYPVKEIINFLIAQNADVICVQEFDECKKGSKSLTQVLKKYKYYYLPVWVVGPHVHKSGNAIFSKYPIINKDSSSFEDGHNVIKSDIAIRNDTISFFSTHLSSYKFSDEEFEEIDESKTAKNLEQHQQKNIVKKLRNSLLAHVGEVDVIKDFLKTTSHPKIFCADLNEVATSNTYWRLQENMQDAFLENGRGFGKTYNSLWPILRIDYIITDKIFNIHQFSIKPTVLSDHNLIVADVSLKNSYNK